MIRHLHPTDSPSLLPFKQRSGPDEVYTLRQVLKGAPKSFPLMKYTTIALSPRAWQSCWVATRRTSVQAVLRAGPRSGQYAWEVGDLFINRRDSGIALDVLEQLAFPAGTSGARRIFIRLPSGSELFRAARAAGYEAAYTEDVFRAPSCSDIVTHIGDEAHGIALRPVDSSDSNSLFRLYCATVPMDARSRTGQTMDEWASSREKTGQKSHDWGVDDSNGTGLEAHVQASDTGGSRYFSVMCRNNARCPFESLVAAGVGQAGEKPAVTVVPSYDRRLSETLQELGFTRHESYDVLVKTLVIPVTKTVPGLIIAG